MEVQTPLRFTSATSRRVWLIRGFAPTSAVCPSTSQIAPASLRARRSEPDQDADDPSDDTSVSILSAPRTIDPEVVGEARNRHNRTVRTIHELLRSRGKRPIKPVGWFGEQPDVVWREHPGYNIVEVKGITGLNEREQLRLGLGQVLRYRFISEKQGHPTQAWLVTDVPPADLLWTEICESLNVRLWWPGSMAPGPGDPRPSVIWSTFVLRSPIRGASSRSVLQTGCRPAFSRTVGSRSTTVRALRENPIRGEFRSAGCT